MNNRLLIITTSIGFGGLARMTRNVANLYVKKGWDVEIALLLDTIDSFGDLDERVKVISFKDFKASNMSSETKKRLSVFKWIKFIKKTVKEYSPSNILTMTLKIGAMTSLAVRGKNRPRIVMREISDPKSKARSQLSNWILYRCSKRIDGIIFQTNWEQQCYPKKMQKKGKVIPNPVVMKERAVYPKRTAFAAMSALTNFQKSIDVMIKAFALFHEKHPEYTLELYGKGEDEASLKELANSLGVSESVHFLGAHKDVHERIKDAKGFVTTSDFEGLSNSLLEAFLMGVPCISSDWPGVEDVITNEKNGLIVKRGDVEGFAKAFERLADDDDLCRKFSENAVKEWERYDTEKVFGQYCDLIEGIKD